MAMAMELFLLPASSLLQHPTVALAIPLQALCLAYLRHHHSPPLLHPGRCIPCPHLVAITLFMLLLLLQLVQAAQLCTLLQEEETWATMAPLLHSWL